MVRKERQADMNRKTGITTTKRQLQLQLEGGGNRRACWHVQTLCHLGGGGLRRFAVACISSGGAWDIVAAVGLRET
jgi:hypothetical protein